MKLEWSLLAVTDREQIFDYIEADDPRAAIAIDDRIREGIETLLQFPFSGRTGRVDGTRELVIAGTPLPIVSRKTPSVFCACCTAPGSGRRTLPIQIDEVLLRHAVTGALFASLW